MKHQHWVEMLAVSHPEEDLSPSEYAALEEHLAHCSECAAIRERYLLMTVHLRAVSAAKPLSANTPQLYQLRKKLAALEKEAARSSFPPQLVAALEKEAARSSFPPQPRGKQEPGRRKSPERATGTNIAAIVVTLMLVLIAFVLFQRHSLAVIATMGNLSALWVIFFGSKSVYDFVHSRKQGKPFKVNPWFIVSTILAIGILVLSSIFVFILSPPYPPFERKQVLNDSLQQTSNGTWQEGPSSDGSASCMFTANAYQVSASKPNSGYGCFDITRDYTDFTFEVQMTIVKGDQGGMSFRVDTTGNGYFFRVNRGGAYKLDVYENYLPSKTLKSGTSIAIHAGFNQPNVVAVVAEGSTIILYVNYQQIASVNDSTYSHGRIGLIADTNNKPPTEVIYSNAKVWIPSS